MSRNIKQMKMAPVGHWMTTAISS